MSISSPAATSSPTEKIRLPAKAGNRGDRIFYACMTFVIVTIVFAGFSPSFFMRPLFERPPLIPLAIVHGIVMTTWLVIFITQTSLITANNAKMHRKLGVVAFGMIPLMLALAWTMTIVTMNHMPRTFNPLPFMVVPMGDIGLFAILAAAAMYYRRNPEAHKRLMILANINIVAPAVFRLGFPQFPPFGFFSFWAVVDVLVLAGPIYDAFRGRKLHPAYLYGGLLIMASQPFRMWFMKTEVWDAIARAITNR
jgi:uncharacterized membrane protein YozB (DUF420 family)